LAADLLASIEHNFAASRQSCILVPLVTANILKNYEDKRGWPRDVELVAGVVGGGSVEHINHLRLCDARACSPDLPGLL